MEIDLFFIVILYIFLLLYNIIFYVIHSNVNQSFQSESNVNELDIYPLYVRNTNMTKALSLTLQDFIA